MENYEKLKKVIQEANPEIMELKFGCEVSYNNEPFMLVSIEFDESEEGNSTYVYNVFPSILVAGEANVPTYFARLIGEYEQFQILGRPIRLADVLLALSEKFPGELIPKFEDYSTTLFMGYWNLKDDNLDNQSFETKQFLINLLVHD